MKKILVFILLLIIPLIGFNQNLGMPGDNLNLFAVLKTFQESPTLEDFEENINNVDLKINNLDLDGNNQIDYISVVEYIDINDAHLITLQIDISEKEKQDLAVITVQKKNGKTDIQIIGDIELYGPNYIIQPNDKIVKTPNPGYKGKIVIYEEYNDFNTWPIIIYIFTPGYSSWHSHWCWGFYPTYFRPWNPLFYHQYYGYHHHNHHYYNRHYKQTNSNNYSNWYNYYGSRRNSSNIIIKKRESGEYKKTYSRPDLEKQGQRLHKQDNTSIYKNERQVQQRQVQQRQVQQRQVQQRQEQRQEQRQVQPRQEQRQEQRQVQPSQQKQIQNNDRRR